MNDIKTSLELHIFRTDIKSKKKVKSISATLNNHPAIIDWSIDLEDIDNVLRIEATDSLHEAALIQLIKMKGFFISVLQD